MYEQTVQTVQVLAVQFAQFAAQFAQFAPQGTGPAWAASKLFNAWSCPLIYNMSLQTNARTL